MTSHAKTKRLFRSEKDRVIGGVCGGIAAYFDIDPTLVRLVFVLITLSGGAGVFLYILLWIVIPTESSIHAAATEPAMKENAKEVELRAKQFAKEAEGVADRSEAKLWLGTVLAIVGCWLLLSNLGIVHSMFLGKLWPLVLVVAGVVVLTHRNGKGE